MIMAGRRATKKSTTTTNVTKSNQSKKSPESDSLTHKQETTVVSDNKNELKSGPANSKRSTRGNKNQKEPSTSNVAQLTEPESKQVSNTRSTRSKKTVAFEDVKVKEAQTESKSGSKRPIRGKNETVTAYVAKDEEQRLKETKSSAKITKKAAKVVLTEPSTSKSTRRTVDTKPTNVNIGDDPGKNNEPSTPRRSTRAATRASTAASSSTAKVALKTQKPASSVEKKSSTRNQRTPKKTEKSTKEQNLEIQPEKVVKEKEIKTKVPAASRKRTLKSEEKAVPEKKAVKTTKKGQEPSIPVSSSAASNRPTRARRGATVDSTITEQIPIADSVATGRSNRARVKKPPIETEVIKTEEKSTTENNVPSDQAKVPDLESVEKTDQNQGVEIYETESVASPATGDASISKEPRIDEPDDEKASQVNNADKNQATDDLMTSEQSSVIEMDTIPLTSSDEKMDYTVEEVGNEKEKSEKVDTELLEKNQVIDKSQKKETEGNIVVEISEKSSEENEKTVISSKPVETEQEKKEDRNEKANSSSKLVLDTESVDVLLTNGSLKSEKKMDVESESNLKRKFSDEKSFPSEELMPEKKRLRCSDVGDLFTMGEQISKELGPREVNFNGKKVSRSQPARVKVHSMEKISQVAMGALHTLALTAEGRVLSFGCNDDFVLGRLLTKEEMSNGNGSDDMDTDDDELEEKLSGKPLPVKEIKAKVIKVTAGDMHSAALCQNGKVYIWGNFKDESDKVGLFADSEKSPNNSDYLPTILPRLIEFDMNVIDIASGSHHFLMLTDEGKVYTLGEGSKGQLGRIISKELNSIKTNRDLFLKPHPVFIPDQAVIERVFASQWNSFALSNDGKLYGWGLNNYYQLGIKNDFISQANSLNSDSLFTLIPTKIPIPFKASQVSNGQQHSICLDHEGNVYTCGSALYGKLGHGEDFVKQCGDDKSISEFKQIPATVFNNERIIKVDCGDFCSMCITESGKLYCWGQGSSHIGTEDGIDLFEPKQIGGPYAECTKFLAISTGAQMAAMVGEMQEPQLSPKSTATSEPSSEAK